ncbi:tumor necrosis factor receptor superfamily member 23-like isoform X2 [Myotis daubentonii]|uniref:tumor necrosis factor receptor superfamily member 23-like isoform X2 n=1 Tax=Myotis daubentonii TaxID=98922 RepID=UPI002872BF0E|nr:tumor necrosis factor receptor superfamily member 23-like isoform X2 [Myotis daubentonii]
MGLALWLLPLLLVPLTLSTSSNLSSKLSAASLSPGSRCGPGEYWSGRRCCQRCPAGQYVEEPCSSPHTRSKCEACDTGTYTGHANGLPSCLPCTTCRKDQEMVSDCTPTQDRQCQCKTGEYYCDSEHCLEGCNPCTSCPGATLQTCTPTRDTVCAPAAQPEPGSCRGSRPRGRVTAVPPPPGLARRRGHSSDGPALARVPVVAPPGAVMSPGRPAPEWPQQLAPGWPCPFPRATWPGLPTVTMGSSPSSPPSWGGGAAYWPGSP